MLIQSARRSVHNYRDKDPLVRRLLQGMVVTFLAFAVLATMNVRAWLDQPPPVAVYDPVPLMVGTLDEADNSVTTPVSFDQVPLVAMDNKGVALVPLVLSRCTKEGPVDVSSTLTVAIDFGLPNPTLVPRGMPASLTFDDGCTGITGTQVLLSAPTVQLMEEADGAWLRFQLKAEDRATTVVGSERFRLARPLEVSTAPVRRTSLDPDS